MGKSRLTHATSTFHLGVSSTAIARNAPCPCGSGKRFKDCHGTTRLTPAAAPTAESLLRDAQLAFAAGSGRDALELISSAIALEPGRADLLRERARVEWALADPDAAASARAALERSPTDVRAWNLLGEILGTTDPEGAEQAWRRALELDPGDAEALFHMGNRLRERGETEGAIDHYEHALVRAPGHVGVTNNLGLALETAGQIERAEACYRAVLAREPRHADALGNLAN